MRQRFEKSILIHVHSATDKNTMCWKHLISVKDKMEDDDVIKEFVWRNEKVEPSSFGMSDYRDEVVYERRLYICISRWVLESDEEYVERVKRETRIHEENEKREYETYLRLKGKFEK